MKNAIIAGLMTYIFYDFCIVRNFLIPIVVFFTFWALVSEIEEIIKDLKELIKDFKKGGRK